MVAFAKSSYLAGIDSLPPDLAIRGAVTDPLTRNQAKRLERHVWRIAAQIIKARQEHERRHGPLPEDPTAGDF